MRKRLFVFNTVSALIKQIVTIVCGFILPKYILTYYGSDVNGTITSITQFLGFISFLEMGIGPVIQSNLYKPLAEKNNAEISKIIVSAEKFFKRIAYIFLGYIIVLIVIFPIVINGSFDRFYTGSLIIIISISTFAQYYFGITYQLLLNADQRSYIQTTMQIATIVLNTLCSVILIMMNCSIQIVKLVTAIIYLIRPIGQAIYVHKNYEINKNIIYQGEPIKQKWNGFAQHLASVVVANTDITVLSIFSTMKAVSIYSVYYNVVYGIESAVMTMVGSLEALWGNMIANNEKGRLIETFEEVENIMHLGCTILFIMTSILIVPFVKVYTMGIGDANYEVPVFGVLLTVAYGIECLRVPYFRMIKAAGHYKQTQNGAFIEMIINILVSIVAVFKYGLNGVAVGTLIAMLYHTIYFAWYLKNHILYRKLKHFVKHIIIDVLSGTVCFMISFTVNKNVTTYIMWIILAIKIGVICISICSVINILFYRKFYKKLMGTLKKIIRN